MTEKKKLRIGDTAAFTKKITSEEIYQFAIVSGDDNPVHVDKEYAKNSMKS